MLKLKRITDNIVLYHVTKLENLPSIKKYGLQTKYFKYRKENKLLGVDEKNAIYFTKDINKLVKPFRKGKDCIIEITIPKQDYNKLPKIDGDQEWGVAEKHKNYIRYRSSIMKKAYPDSFKNKSINDIIKLSTPMEYMSPENTVCILSDIPSDYITKIIK